ncbi:MAG TPA: energy transducer TonB [Candidatus Binatia bacterium]
MNDKLYGVPLGTSLLLHGVVLFLAAALVRHGNQPRQDFLPVSLVEVTPTQEKETAAPADKPVVTSEVKSKETKPAVKNPAVDRQILPPVNDEDNKAAETKANQPPVTDTPAIASKPRLEGGGSEAGATNTFGKSEVAVIPGSGNSGGTGGTAITGLGRASGAPGLPAQSAPLRTNREAKAIQTARPTYPPMALRMGMESDVMMKIIVDSEGHVTKAEILKSGGAGFDDEALKAVKQSRFEPGQVDGQAVAAEFTFIYRFRLQK